MSINVYIDLMPQLSVSFIFKSNLKNVILLLLIKIILEIREANTERIDGYLGCVYKMW
jgi:hypothetical protein